MAGVTDVSEWHVIEWDPPRRQLQFSSSKNLDTRLVIEIEQVRGASLVRETAILNSRLPPPFSWLHEALFSIVSRQGLRSCPRTYAVKSRERRPRAPGAPHAVADKIATAVASPAARQAAADT